MKPLRCLAAVGIAGACVLVVGCAADRVSGLKPAAERVARPAAAEAGACRFTVKAIEDRREEASLGVLLRTRVDGDGFNHWFADGINAVPGYTREAAPIELRIEVLKAYIHSIATMKSANLVVRVHVAASGAPPQAKTYRGSDGSVNWSSSEREVQEAFDNAMTDLTTQIGADLRGLCR